MEVNAGFSGTDRVLFDDAGNVVEYQGVGRDITHRRLAEEAINRQNAILTNSGAI